MSELEFDRKSQFTFSNEFIHINAFIEIAKDTLSKIDGNIGYSYLSNFRENWQRRLKHWKDTVITSNNQTSSFKRMYETLETHITSLNILINNDQNELKAK